MRHGGGDHRIGGTIRGLAHAANPGATPFTIFALTVDLGILLSLAYVLTRNIWLAVGMHMVWNFMQGFVFGTEVSGSREPSSFFTTLGMWLPRI